MTKKLLHLVCNLNLLEELLEAADLNVGSYEQHRLLEYNLGY